MLAGAMLAWPLAAPASDWPQFRGPNGSGISTGAPPPAVFGPGTNRLWSTPVPPGHSSPVLAAGRVFLTASEGGRLLTLALDARDGRVLWKQAAPEVPLEKVHEFASVATPTPLAVGDRVLAYFGSFGLLCYDLAGRELWRRPLPVPRSLYGTGSSPVRHGTYAVLALDSDDRSSRLLAVSLADGSTAWETPRPLATSGWATPVVWSHGGTDEIVVLGAKRLNAYDAATGRDRWWIDGYSAETIGTPVTDGATLYVSSAGLGGPPSEGFESMAWPELARLDRDGDGRVSKAEVPADFRFVLRPELPPDNPGRFQPTPFLRMFDGIDGDRDGFLTESEFATFIKRAASHAAPTLRAIRPGGSGDATSTHVAWQVARGIPEIPSPLLHRGRILMARDGGFLSGVDAASGRVLWQERVGAGGSYCASPVAAGDRVFVASHDGVVTSLDLSGASPRVLSNNALGARVWATPALGDGTIVVRTAVAVSAFGTPPKTEN